MNAQRTPAHTHIIGDSERTHQVVRLVKKVGKGRWPVLLLGETGTGKEVVARAIHNTNPAGPMVTIDCSSLVGPLMESELFGHTRGAFTGAVGTKIGLIEMANDGTAFFDEIGELPLDLQAKLLRVLQEKEFRPVGSLASRTSDFRIVAATNRDLAKDVQRGTFRRDLYYRLNVVTMKLAPLRDRKADIVPLMDHFLRRHKSDHKFTQEAINALMEYDWPGNVRELENCIQQMLAINTGPLLHVGDLPSPIQNFLQVRKAGAFSMAAGAGSGSVATNGSSSPERKGPASAIAGTSADAPVIPLNEVERRAILQALDYTNGDRAIAASLLGIGRTTLYRKLKEYRVAS